MFVYILKSSDNDFIKIGKSKNILNSLKTLPYKFDLSNSYYFNVGNNTKIEGSLHKLLYNYKLCKEVVDGYTELFSIEAFDKAITILEVAGFTKLKFSYVKVIKCSTPTENYNPTIIKNDIGSTKEYLGLSIKNRRKDLNIDRDFMLDYADIGSTTLSKLENGKANITLDNLIKILDILGFDLLLKYKGI
jgi:hypothetical protein